LTIKDFTIKQALNRAVAMEEQSYSLYRWAADRSGTLGSKRLLEELAMEEQSHKEKLLSLIDDEKRISDFIESHEKILDLKIVDYLTDINLSEEMDYQETLIYAGKREKDTSEYYQSLSKQFEGTEIGRFFNALAAWYYRFYGL